MTHNNDAHERSTKGKRSGLLKGGSLWLPSMIMKIFAMDSRVSATNRFGSPAQCSARDVMSVRSFTAMTKNIAYCSRSSERGFERSPAVQPGEVGQALNRWLTAELFTLPSVITNPGGRGELSIARFGLGLEDEVGVVVAGSRRADFPTEIETLLLRVAANQMAIGLQEARRRRDQNRATEELERRVAERTADLRRVNEQLRAENAERKRAEDALRRSEAYLAEAQRLSHTGSWARNILTGEVFWSQEMFRMYGFDPGMQITFEKIIQERVHPEDVFWFVHTGETAIREKTDLEYGNRIVLPDGSIRFHHSVAHPVVNAAGEVVEWVGTTMEVTEQHTARTALEGSP